MNKRCKSKKNKINLRLVALSYIFVLMVGFLVYANFVPSMAFNAKVIIEAPAEGGSGSSGGEAYNPNYYIKYIGTSTDKLEFNEPLNNVIPYLTDPRYLKPSTISNLFGTSTATQTLKLPEAKITYTIDPNYITKVEPIAKIIGYESVYTYTVAFSPAIKSDHNTGGNGYLEDIRNKKIRLLGKTYTVLVADHPSQNHTVLTLMGGAVTDVIDEGETKTYTLNGKEYTVTAAYISSSSTKLKVNNELTAALAETQTYRLNDGIEIGIIDILGQNLAGEVDRVEFSLGSDKLKIDDSNTRVVSNDRQITTNSGLLATLTADIICSQDAGIFSGADIYLSGIQINYYPERNSEGKSSNLISAITSSISPLETTEFSNEYATSTATQTIGRRNLPVVVYEDPLYTESSVKSYLKFDAGKPIYEYSLDFAPPLKSQHYSEYLVGASLEGIEGKKVEILGTKYTILSTSHSLQNTAYLKLVGKSVTDIIKEGETKSYTLNNKNYDVTIVNITKFFPGSETDAVTLRINNEITSLLFKRSAVLLMDNTDVAVQDIDETKTIHFALSQNVIEIMDQNTRNEAWDATVRADNQILNYTKADIFFSMDEGTENNDTIELSSIRFKYELSKDIYLKPETKINEKIAPEPLFSVIDYRYDGLKIGNTEYINLIPSGYFNYKLSFTNKAGIVYNEAVFGFDGTNYKLGRYSGSTWHEMIIDEPRQIDDEDSFCVSKNGYSRILQYQDVIPGASYSDNEGTVRIKDLGTGDVISRGYQNLSGDLILDGNIYNIKVSGDSNSATLSVDMNGDDDFEDYYACELWTKYGAKIRLLPNPTLVFTSANDENGKGELMAISLEQNSEGEIDLYNQIEFEGNMPSSLQQEPLSEIRPSSLQQKAIGSSVYEDYTHYGVFLEMDRNGGGTDTQNELRMVYPDRQVTGDVYVQIKKMNITQINCTDSDAGKNYYKSGNTYGIANFISGEAAGKSDVCSEDTLTEYYCIDEETMGYEQTACPIGCQNGACTKDETQYGCSDSDTGKDYYEEGQVTYYTFIGHAQQLNILYDECLGNTLSEAFCNTEGIGEGVAYDCQLGCANRTCLMCNYDGICEGIEDMINCQNDCDHDKDGYSTDIDCNDTSVSINPNITETCNYIDDDCDDFIDENVSIISYRDLDSDSFGTASNPTTACLVIPSGYVANNKDCNDSEPNINPTATELQDKIDNDCNNKTDEGFISGTASSINSGTFKEINIKIENNTNLAGKFIGPQAVTIYEQNESLIEFLLNFSDINLDLNNITIERQPNNSQIGSIEIKNLRLTGTKAVKIDRIAGYNHLCIKDQEGAQASQISEFCNAAYELSISCPGTSGQYSCSIQDNHYILSGLRNSAVKEHTLPPEPVKKTHINGGGGGGGSGNIYSKKSKNQTSMILTPQTNKSAEPIIEQNKSIITEGFTADELNKSKPYTLEDLGILIGKCLLAGIILFFMLMYTKYRKELKRWDRGKNF